MLIELCILTWIKYARAILRCFCALAFISRRHSRYYFRTERDWATSLVAFSFQQPVYSFQLNTRRRSSSASEE
jgi:hypothetical protein